MGCYLSVPDDKVYVTEGKGPNYTYATASCQGWRREQEDAEDCIPSFEEDASLFVLCDGHGGAEVAKYTVEHFPNFIKNHALYKEGKYAEALEAAFIDFDALLRTDDVMAELERISMEHENHKDVTGEEDEIKTTNAEEDDPNLPQASSSTGSSSSLKNGNSSVVEDVDTDTLRREAQVPLRKLIDEYTTNEIIDQSKRRLLNTKFNNSPVVKSKREEGDGSDENGTESNPAQDNSTPSTSEEPCASSSKTGENEEPEQGSSTASNPPVTINQSLIEQMLKRYFPNDGEDDSSDDSEYDAERSNVEDGDDEDDEDGTNRAGKKLKRKKHRRPVGESSDGSSTDDSDDSDDVDDEEDEDDDDQDDDDEQADEQDDDEEEDECDDDDDDDDDEEEEDDDVDPMAILGRPAFKTHKPGMDSGCTVVVALVKGHKLYVASAGDSRCITIYRNGTCRPLSFDHKPEDPIERKRIVKAGGRVTEGRVNGGLNLSRAFGDFTYKLSELSARDQMITPCPDVKTADLDPNEVEYLFLACDGIWNSMKNQEVARFIRKTAPEVNNNLIEICVNLFRSCIAPKTDGDGTGCDNMTCIIAKFDDPNEVKSENSDLKEEPQLKSNNVDPTSGAAQKRLIHEESSDKPMKRRCLRL